METVKGRESIARKKKTGRPVKAIKRNKLLMVRLTLAEFATIKNKAAQARTTASDWFRQAACNATVKPRISPEDMSYLRSLSGLCNNLNQLTKLAHTSGLITLSTECRRLMEQAGTLVEKLMNPDKSVSHDR